MLGPDYAVFLNSLAKHTTGWRRTDWDINPIFTMSAILLKEHPYHFAVRIVKFIDKKKKSDSLTDILYFAFLSDFTTANTSYI